MSKKINSPRARFKCAVDTNQISNLLCKSFYCVLGPFAHLSLWHYWDGFDPTDMGSETFPKLPEVLLGSLGNNFLGRLFHKRAHKRIKVSWWFPLTGFPAVEMFRARF